MTIRSCVGGLTACHRNLVEARIGTDIAHGPSLLGSLV
ncbi:hypothetical protein JMJ77_0007470 [Colletotrichum scovillei]|uniref:Uncharacterized protein n=1 Tax=Colletotrichum scovillei TaxID=1209932 RepID=A0A9P7UGL2_9PEZI|nr:hypothetical protein JMJ77_0007470 [Colletotrichum scovillei]KAG7074473.1 hypothetical protein JMJ76_0010951 [Colletotrichum scovillei]KAG7081553.1 hypothetical protein JMJ78_0003671 [Colletotrichum scovillei]